MTNQNPTIHYTFCVKFRKLIKIQMNVNNGPKYGGSSSTRLTVKACYPNVWLHEQTNPHGHIVYIAANSNIFYRINVMLNVHGKKFRPV